MTMTTTDLETFSSLLAAIASPALRALALGCAAGLGLAAFRVNDTIVRLFTWSVVLYAALAMPFLGWMLPPLSIPAPAFLHRAVLQDAAERTAATQVHAARPAISDGLPLAEDSRTQNHQAKEDFLVSPAPSISSADRSGLRWSAVAACVYLAVAGLLLIRFFLGLAFARRLRHSSHAIEEPRLKRKISARGWASGLKIIPPVVESELVSVPVTMGALHSTIILPAGWREWDDAKLDAVVAHEVSHAARRDALTQRLSLIHRAIFWFSPLAWWLHKHLGELAEQASDEAALSCGVDRKDYARSLLEFFEALHATPGRVWWQGVSMAKAGQAEQRVERILCWKGCVAMSVKKSVAVAVIALAVPVVYIAASARPAGSNLVLQDAHFAQSAAEEIARPAVVPQVAPNAKPTPAIAPAAAVATEPITASAPAVAAVVPIATVAAVAPISERGYSYSYGYDEDERFVIVTGKSDSLTMSGSAGDAKHVEKLRKSIPGDFIWFQSDEKSYIIRDQATIDRARKLWAPQEELGKKQEELGKQQEALGKQQEALGAKMEQVHVTVPDMTAELDRLKAELKNLNASATVEQIGQVQSEIGELQSKIGELQSQAGERQSKLGEQQSALGEQQGRLGEQQGELGRQQGELAEKASREMKVLLEDAVKKGIAQPEL